MGSMFKSIAILDILKDSIHLSPEQFNDFEKSAEELSKILFAMIRNLEK